MKTDYTRIPSLTIEGLVNYIDHGLPPGSYLTAVLESNLFEAMGRADDGNAASLQDLVRLIYNHAPAGSWGSAEAVGHWLSRSPSRVESPGMDFIRGLLA